MNFFIKITSKSISLSLLGLFLCLSTAAFGQSYSVKDIPNVQLADRTKFTSNPDNILSTAAVAKIDSMLYALKAQGKAQVVVAAVNSIGTESPKNFVHNLLNEWGVGSKGADNGLAILLVLDQGAIEIETGYGLEGDLPDAICKRIINNYMLPSFRQKDWDSGMVAGVRAIYDILNGIEPTGVADNDLNADGSSQIILALVIIGLTIFAPILLLFLASYRRRKCPNCKKHTLKRTNSKIIEKTAKKYVVLETYVCTNCGYVVTRRKTHYNDSSGGSSGGGGPVIFGGGGGSRSGGFGGGFGGGRSGGGGAGGRF